MSYAIVLEQPLWSDPESLLSAKLQRVGLDPREARWVYLFERGTKPSTTAMKAEMPRILEELRGVDAALLLGGTPLQAVSGQTSITKSRGSVRGVRREMADLESVPFFATLHPSIILRTPNYTNGWVADLAAFKQLVNPPEDNDRVVLVNDRNSWEECLAAITRAKTGALDIETTVAEGDHYWENQLVTMAMTFDGETAYVITYKHPERPDVEMAPDEVRLFQHRFNDVEWIMHNGLFDRLLLREVTNKTLDPILKHDTMAMAYLLYEDERKGLEILSSIYLGEPPYKGVDYKHILDEPLDKIATMNGKDTLRTFRLFRPLADELNENKQLSRLYQWLLMPAVNTLIRVTENGVPVDQQRLAALTEAKEAAEAAALDSVQSIAPAPHPSLYPDGWPKHKDPSKNQRLNPASTKQMRHVLYDIFRLPILKHTETGEPSTDADTLTQLAVSVAPTSDKGIFIDTLLEYRQLSKQVSSYLHSWPNLWREHGDGVTRLHPRYKPLHVATGRLSSEAPNIQQVPRNPEFRNVFGGVPGFSWVKADYSQLELRIAAGTAKERIMLAAYEAGEDLHALTARLVLGVTDVTQEFKPGTTARDTAKTLNFGLLYGAYPKTLQRIARMNYGVHLTLREAETYRERFFDTYPGLARWHKSMERTIRTQQQATSVLGRIRRFPAGGSEEFKEWSQAVREGTNHPVQSFGSDLLLMSMVRVQEWIDRNNTNVKIIAEVHDEIDLLVPTAAAPTVMAEVKAIMEDVSWLSRFGVELNFPVVADVGIGTHWGALE